MTPADLRALGGAERIALLTKLAEGRYGSDWKAPLAREMEYDRTAIFRWIQRQEVPAPVLYALAAWAYSGETHRAELAQLARLMTEQAKSLERIILQT